MSSNYTDQASIQNYIDPDALNAALDDNDSGNANPALLAAIIQEASLDIDGRLSSIYSTPFPAWPGSPPVVHAAATIFACEIIRDRRLPPDAENPFRKRADVWRERLKLIGKGELNLDFRFPRAFFQGNAIVEPMLVNRNSLGI